MSLFFKKISILQITILLVSPLMILTTTTPAFASSASCEVRRPRVGLEKVEHLFRQAHLNDQDVVYMVTGDSTRGNDYNEADEYYSDQLAKINMGYYDNAQAGQYTRAWQDNDSFQTSTIDDAVANSKGINGEHTIMEFSMGINDWTYESSTSEIKQVITSAIAEYQSQKPEAAIFFVRPVPTANTERADAVNEVYDELSASLNIPMIDSYDALDGFYPSYDEASNDYYYNVTHPNRFGSRRLVNFILESVIPEDLSQHLTIEEYPSIPSPTPTTSNIAEPVDIGYYLYDQTDLTRPDMGTDRPSVNHRNMDAISITPGGHSFLVRHGGDKADMFFMGENSEFLERLLVREYVTKSGNEYLFTTAPTNAHYLHINIQSSPAEAYDLLGDVPEVFYAEPGDFVIMSKAAMNTGLTFSSYSGSVTPVESSITWNEGESLEIVCDNVSASNIKIQNFESSTSCSTLGDEGRVVCSGQTGVSSINQENLTVLSVDDSSEITTVAIDLGFELQTQATSSGSSSNTSRRSAAVTVVEDLDEEVILTTESPEQSTGFLKALAEVLIGFPKEQQDLILRGLVEYILRAMQIPISL